MSVLKLTDKELARFWSYIDNSAEPEAVGRGLNTKIERDMVFLVSVGMDLV